MEQFGFVELLGGNRMDRAQFLTVRKFLFEEQRKHPEATGQLTNLVLDIILGCKKVGFEIRRFGLSQFTDLTGAVNVQEERVHALDELADSILVDLLLNCGEVCAVATEEHAEIFPVTVPALQGDYVVMLDPLDGSSNIGVNINIGTIFSVHKRLSADQKVGVDDFLQPGSRQVCAGYVIYGPSIILVFTNGHGVHEFTYDETIGEFILSRANITIPSGKGNFSVNEGYSPIWDEKTRRVFAKFKNLGFSGRHVGSLVADFHRNLLTGGMFSYPRNEKSPNGKLRLLCELSPMAFLLDQAGGKASDGRTRILDIKPKTLHQRCPVFMGSADAVEIAEGILS